MFTYFIRTILNSSNERFLYLFLQALRVSSQNNKKSKLLTEFKIYPKYPKRLYPINSESNNVSVIIQGPIVDRNFIQETINWYRACGIPKIIVTTTDLVQDFKRATTVVYEKPKVLGLGNENSHLLSIRKGLDLIDNNDIVIKTRSDMRIFNELALSAIPTVHRTYTSNITKDGFRLGAVANNSLLIKLNNISDHLYVSSASQLKKMFDIPFREFNKVLSEITVEPDLLVKEERGYLLKTTLFTSTFTEFFGEQWFFNSYRRNCLIKNMSEERVIDYQNYRECLSKYLEIVRNSVYILDPGELDLYWLKRNFSTLPSYYENGDQNKKPISFLHLTRLCWLSLYYDASFKEKILNFTDSLDPKEVLL